MLRPVLFVLSILAAALSQPSFAREISGQKDPAYKAAVETWLAGEDLKGLQQLSDLAHDGNTAAQILLGSIATRGSLHQHVTGDLPRKERIALLRARSGISGTSWLTIAQETDPLATALFQSIHWSERGPAMLALFEYGEMDRAMLAANALRNFGQGEELVGLLSGYEDQLPDAAQYVVLQAAIESSRSTAMRHAWLEIWGERRFLTAKLAWELPSVQDLLNDQSLRAKVNALSIDVPSWTPVERFCRANCPSSVNSCTTTGAVSAFWGEPLAVSSPLQSLISNETYWASPRAAADLARLVPDLETSFRFLTKLDACYFYSMKTAQKKYGALPRQ